MTKKCIECGERFEEENTRLCDVEYDSMGRHIGESKTDSGLCDECLRRLEAERRDA